MLRHAYLVFLIGFSSVAIGTSDSAEEATVCLKYDDGTQESKRSITGAGHAVRFECPDDQQWYISSLAVHGSRYGTPRAPREKFSVFVASEDLTEVVKTAKPYSLFERGDEKWVKFAIPPVKVPKVFQVVVFFNPTRTKGVYVGIDQDSSPTHSMTVVPDDRSKSKSDLTGDWMIQAYVTKTPPKSARSLLSARAQSGADKKHEADEDARLLGDTRSITLKHDAGTMKDHLNIRGAVYTVAFQTPKDVEAYVWQAQVYASQFGGQHDSEAVNGDVYVLDENRKVLSRSTFSYSLATQQKQWVAIPTLPTRVQGKFFISVDTHGEKSKGLYMGYAAGNDSHVASTDEINEDSIKPGDWSSKFADKQWMIRVKVADRPVVYGNDPSK